MLRPTLLQEDTFKQRVLVPEHQAFVGGGSVALLQILQRIFMMLDGLLQLLDILRPPLSEGRLGLSVALFSLFRGGIYLATGQYILAVCRYSSYRLSAALPFLRRRGFLRHRVLRLKVY